MDPLIVRWDRTVIPPDPDNDRHPHEQTIVCCQTYEGQPVALWLDPDQIDRLIDELNAARAAA